MNYTREGLAVFIPCITDKLLLNFERIVKTLTNHFIFLLIDVK